MSATPVYRNMDQEALDAQYNNRKRFPDYKERFNTWSELSDKTRAPAGRAARRGVRLSCQRGR